MKKNKKSGLGFLEILRIFRFFNVSFSLEKVKNRSVLLRLCIKSF